MISAKSILTFLKINVILLIIATVQYYSFNSAYLPLIHILINYFLVFLIYYPNKNKKSINKNQINISTAKDHYYLISTSSLDLILIKMVQCYINFKKSNILLDLLYFIPVSFIFEIIFDFFHYWIHRYGHTNKYLYIYFHKSHHLNIISNVWTTFHQNPIDYICNNGIPMILTTLIVNYFIGLSFYQFSMILIYKIFIEISGHCGKIIKATSFTQNIWIAKLLNIELRTECHDLHHTSNNCNYSKRFSLWDKVFNTYLNKSIKT